MNCQQLLLHPEIWPSKLLCYKSMWCLLGWFFAVFLRIAAGGIEIDANRWRFWGIDTYSWNRRFFSQIDSDTKGTSINRTHKFSSHPQKRHTQPEIAFPEKLNGENDPRRNYITFRVEKYGCKINLNEFKGHFNVCCICVTTFLFLS